MWWVGALYCYKSSVNIYIVQSSLKLPKFDAKTLMPRSVFHESTTQNLIKVLFEPLSSPFPLFFPPYHVHAGLAYYLLHQQYLM